MDSLGIRVRALVRMPGVQASFQTPFPGKLAFDVLDLLVSESGVVDDELAEAANPLPVSASTIVAETIGIAIPCGSNGKNRYVTWIRSGLTVNTRTIHPGRSVFNIVTCPCVV